MCGPSDNFEMTPQEVMVIDGQASSCKTCCDTVYKRDFHYIVDGIKQLVNEESSYNTHESGETPSLRGPAEWTGEIIIDQIKKQVIIITKMKAINKTGGVKEVNGIDVTVPKVTDDDLSQICASKIIPAIRKYWNTKPYKILVTDGKCDLEYQIFFSPVFLTSGTPHYEVEFYNTGTLRSFVNQSGERPCKWDLKDSASASGLTDLFSIGPKTLEAHEYGHMLGLLDEYSEIHDLSGDGDGVDLIEYKKGTVTKDENGKVTGGTVNRVIESYIIGSKPKNINHDLYDYEYETDRGGCKYIFPDKAETPETARATTEMMSDSRSNRTGAIPSRYMIPVAEAIIKVMGTVQDIKIS